MVHQLASNCIVLIEIQQYVSRIRAFYHSYIIYAFHLKMQYYILLSDQQLFSLQKHIQGMTNVEPL